MKKRKYNSEEVVEIVVEALMNYRSFVKKACLEAIEVVVDKMYDTITCDIKRQFDF